MSEAINCSKRRRCSAEVDFSRSIMTRVFSGGKTRMTIE
jgi:hypothetical protein